MNKENQKKYKEYQKLQAKVKKAQAKVDKLYEAYEKVTQQQAEAFKKVEKQWTPKIKKAYETMADLRDYTEVERANLSTIRKVLVASDNPDRKELIDLILS